MTMSRAASARERAGRRFLDLATSPGDLALTPLQGVVLTVVAELTRAGVPAPERVVATTLGGVLSVFGMAVGELEVLGLVERSHYGAGEAQQPSLTITAAGAAAAARLRGALEEPS
jgi:hypothetical protein